MKLFNSKTIQLTSEQFEIYIATQYENKGYQTKLTPKSYDYGVDIIATNQNEKIAIQVKMYESRAVNYKDVMYLYADKDYYNCDKGVLITTGICDHLAIKVAEKLGIEIQDKFKVLIPLTTINNTKVFISESDFDEIWQTYIVPLKGQSILTASGKINMIINVNNDFLKRQSSTGKVSKVDKQIFKTVFYRLKEKRLITREEINTEYTKRASAIISAVLGKVPFITLTGKPKVKLNMNM